MGSGTESRIRPSRDFTPEFYSDMEGCRHSLLTYPLFPAPGFEAVAPVDMTWSVITVQLVARNP